MLNRLVATTEPGVSGYLHYDPLGRLAQLTGSPISDRTFLYDGLESVAEYSSGGAMQRRTVFGPGIDEPLVTYDPGGVRRFLHADERGSIVAASDAAANLAAGYSYDEFGVPAAANSGRFQYTGQLWLHEIGVQYSKARMYAPHLGRFPQPDPIGYWDSPNLYAYVLNDPINLIDPLGLRIVCVTGPGTIDGVVVSVSVTSCTDVPFEDDESTFHGVLTSGTVIGSPVDRRAGLGGSPHSAGTGTMRQPRVQCTSPNDTVTTARDVLEAVALGADVATVGLVAAGITAPVAVAAKGVGLFAEFALAAVNTYDAFAYGNWQPLAIQGVGIGARLAPGGRAFQQGLLAARGPAGTLRNSVGQFRSSLLSNPGIEQAANVASQRYAEALVGTVACPR